MNETFMPRDLTLNGALGSGLILPRPKASVLFWSGGVAAAIPVALAVYWFAFGFAPEGAGSALRVILLACAAVFAFLWHAAPLTHAEVMLVRVLSAAAAMLLAPAVMAASPAHATAGFIKILVLFAFCCLLTRGLRHAPSAQVFGVALLLGGAILVAFILYTHVRYLGFVMPTFKSARELKGVQQNLGVSLNSIAFAAVLISLEGLCLVRARWVLTLCGVPPLLIASLVSGSRAPLSMLAVSGFVLLCIHGLRSKYLLTWVMTAVLLVGVVTASFATILLSSDKTLAKATEGRWHLWAVGLAKFSERPLFGYGYESWRDDLVSRLPGEYDLTFELAKNSPGSYHNQYVCILAEEGLIGMIAAGLVIWFLIRSSWLLAFRQWRTPQSGSWPLFVCIFLLLRANFEVPGLFGYGQDPVDYLAYVAMAICVSRFSIEEDAARVESPRLRAVAA